MAYVSPWETLSPALERVMPETGLSKEDAQNDICQAIADRAINIRCKLGKHGSGGFRSQDVLDGRAFVIPTGLKPEDLDWERSRPVKSWTVQREAFSKPGSWDLEWIELSRADVTNVLCTGQPGESVCRNASETVATSTGQPALESNSIDRGPRSSGPRNQAATESPRTRGPRPRKFEKVCGLMKGDIQKGRRSVAELSNMLEKDLAATYGVSRDTARKARKAVVSEFGEK
jgi:hypothetical protein